MEGQFHINDKGEVNPCHAKIKCTLQDFDTKDEAKTFAANKLAEENELMTTLSKKPKKEEVFDEINDSTTYRVGGQNVTAKEYAKAVQNSKPRYASNAPARNVPYPPPPPPPPLNKDTNKLAKNTENNYVKGSENNIIGESSTRVIIDDGKLSIYNPPPPPPPPPKAKNRSTSFFKRINDLVS